MFNLERLVFSALICMSCSAFSGDMGATCSDDNNTPTCFLSGWNFGAQALYLKPTYTGQFSYDAIGLTTAPGAFVGNALKADWSWGFKLEGAYHFKSGNDLSLNWYHYNHSTSNSFLVGRNLNFISANKYTLKPIWNEVNLEYGQTINFGKKTHTRVHLGFQYAQINTIFNNSGFTSNGSPGSGYLDMTYSGVGPRVGVDLIYNFITNFSVYGNAATALVVGNSKFNENETFGTPSINSGSRLTVVPDIELKLGVLYNYKLNHGNLLIDGGYMVINYFNALNYKNSGSETSVGFNGPYIGAKWRGNM
jgi:hypothetical protein